MSDHILPQATSAALEKMVEITKDVIVAFETETNAIALNKNIEFLEQSKRKQNVNLLHNAASKEFLQRKGEFIRSKSPLVKTLLDLQKRLKQEIAINMLLLEPMKSKVKVHSIKTV